MVNSRAMPNARTKKLNRTSARLTEDKVQGASRAMLHAAGLSDEDMTRPQVGIAAMWYDGNPCNMHLGALAEAVREGVRAANMVGLRFFTAGVSDGISMGTDGMSYSLQSRDLIADSIETVMCRPVVRRKRINPRLRQEHARLPDRYGPTSTARR